MNKLEKYRIYIDETGNSDLESSKNPNHRYLSLTGVIFNLEYVRNVLHPCVEDLKHKHFKSHPDDPLILHRKEIVKQKGIYSILKEANKLELFNNDLLNLLRTSEYKVISVLIDKSEHCDCYSVWRHDPYHYCMEVLLERYVLFLKKMTAVGDVMFESRGGKEDMRLKKSFSNLYNTGSNYVEASLFQEYLTSKQLKVKPKSANIAGLQIADLLAHPSRKEMLRDRGIGKEDTYTFGNEIIRILKEKYYQKNGKINGYGKKFLP